MAGQERRKRVESLWALCAEMRVYRRFDWWWWWKTILWSFIVSVRGNCPNISLLDSTPTPKTHQERKLPATKCSSWIDDVPARANNNSLSLLYVAGRSGISISLYIIADVYPRDGLRVVSRCGIFKTFFFSLLQKRNSGVVVVIISRRHLVGPECWYAELIRAARATKDLHEHVLVSLLSCGGPAPGPSSSVSINHASINGEREKPYRTTSVIERGRCPHHLDGFSPCRTIPAAKREAAAFN